MAQGKEKSSQDLGNKRIKGTPGWLVLKPANRLHPCVGHTSILKLILVEKDIKWIMIKNHVAIVKNTINPLTLRSNL